MHVNNFRFVLLQKPPKFAAQFAVPYRFLGLAQGAVPQEFAVGANKAHQAVFGFEQFSLPLDNLIFSAALQILAVQLH